MSELEKKKKFSINHTVFWVPFVLLVGVMALSLYSDQMFAELMTACYKFVGFKFGWLFMITTFVLVALMFIIFTTKYGSIKLGGPEAKPKHTTWRWFAMSLTSGIAIGILFWGPVEPIYFMAEPPVSLGLEPFSEPAAVYAMSQAFMHWAFSPYSMFCFFGLAIALAHYNYGQKHAVSSSLYFLVGDRCSGILGDIVDCICLFALAGGVAASMGMGIMQMGSGLQFTIGLEPTKIVWAVTALVIIFGYIFTSYTGIDRGITWLADKNTKAFFFLIIFIFIVGPTVFICDLGIQSFGHYIQNFIPKSLFTAPISEDPFPRWWDLFYWANWFAFAPIVGMFWAKIAYGRTLREFVSVNFIAPAFFGMAWFAAFGGFSIDLQLKQGVDLWANIQSNGVESAVFMFFNQLPLAMFIKAIFLVLILVSFVTLANGMTTTVSILSCRLPQNYTGEPPAAMKIIWGLIMGSMGLITVCFAEGINGVKMLSVVVGFPTMFLAIAAIFSLLKALWWPNLKWFGQSQYGRPVEINYLVGTEEMD